MPFNPRFLPSFLVLALLQASPHLAKAQQNERYPDGITVTDGATLTIGEGSVVTVVGGDVHIEEGGVLHHEGQLHVGRDLLLEGQLQTVLSGSDEAPRHGEIFVAGEAEYRGSLVVACTDEGAFQATDRDYPLVHYVAGFGALRPDLLPGARWSAEHRDRELVVRLQAGAQAAPERFDLALDGAFDAERQVVSLAWLVRNDKRSTHHVVERFDPATGTWLALTEIGALAATYASAQYSATDLNPPREQRVVRYRVRLYEDHKPWMATQELLVELNRSSQLSVFPNPITTGHFKLLGLDADREVQDLRLLSSEGKLLNVYSPGALNTSPSLELPPRTAAGTYFLQLHYRDGERQTVTLLVVRS